MSVETTVVARVSDVLSGVLNVKLGWRFIKPESQSLPAFFAATHEFGIFKPSLAAYSYTKDLTSLVESP